MNPTFSSPVLTERCTYRWEDLEKAAQGIYTDELKAEQERLRIDFEAQKAPGFGAAAADDFLNVAPVQAASASFAAEPMPEAAPAMKPSSGFTVPFRDGAGFRVKEADTRPAPRRAFFEPPRVMIPTREEATLSAQALPVQTAPAFATAFMPQAASTAAATTVASAPAGADPALLERVAQEAARTVTASLLAQVDIIVAMALKSASGKIKSDVEAAVTVAAQQAVREALSKTQAAI